MIEQAGIQSGREARHGADAPGSVRLGPDAGQILEIVASLAQPSPGTTDPERIDRITALERLKSACAAAQARETVDFKASQLAQQRAEGVPAKELGKGISSQVALARHESTHHAGRLVGLAEALVNEMPQTMDALTRGDTSEWRATVVARETSCLSREDREAVDAEVGPKLPGMSDRGAALAARRAAYRIDPRAVVERAARAERERHVSLQPKPDVMSQLTALLPAAQGIAAYTNLTRSADALKAQGDPRSRGQIMADLLVERLTGQPAAAATPVEVQLLMPAETLLADGGEPATLQGHGPVPAPFARNLLRRLPEGAEAFVRRLFADPAGRLAGLDSHRRSFGHTLRTAVVARDEYCRTPWCGAPIRHIDHVTRHHDGGRTTAANAQGLCAACNQAKEAPGWSARPDAICGAGAGVTTTTPTGHAYRSSPPALPGRQAQPSRIERVVVDMIHRHGLPRFEAA